MNKEKIIFDDIGFAKLDPHRRERTGIPEAVFCQGKTSEQVGKIVNTLLEESGENVLATRATKNDYQETIKLVPEAEYYEEARIIVARKSEKLISEKKIAVLTAGTADIPVAEEAAVTAETYGVKVDRIYDVGVAGIERLFHKLERIKEADVVIVVAGMEGALASVVGGLVAAPIIAVPTSVGYGANFEGLSALLSMLNSCAAGVGIVNIDNGFGAACLAIKIIQGAK